MPTGSITQDQVEFVEEWENVSPMVNYIIRLDVRGEPQQEAVEGPRKFKITTEERILTEDKILERKHNPFRNGCFRPITVPDEISIESNPNALSNEEILKIFRSSDLAWEGWMDTLDSPATLQRMVDLAEEAEEISLRRYRQLQDRHRQIAGELRHATQKDEDVYKEIGQQSGGGSKKRMTKD